MDNPVYSCSEDCVRVERVKSQPFIDGIGLRQWCVLPPFLFIVYIKVLQTTAREQNPTCVISPGRKTHLLIMKKSHIYKKCVHNISRKNHITQDVRPSNCCSTAYVVLSQKFGEPDLYEIDRQSQTRRRGCHCWELHDEPLTFCGRVVTACVDLHNRVFSTLFIVLCCVRPSRNENQR